MHTPIPIHTYIHTLRSVSLGCFELEEIENSNSNGLNNKILDTLYNKKSKIRAAPNAVQSGLRCYISAILLA